MDQGQGLGDSKHRRHNRNISYTRSPLARHPTKGPLDIDEYCMCPGSGSPLLIYQLPRSKIAPEGGPTKPSIVEAGNPSIPNPQSSPKPITAYSAPAPPTPSTKKDFSFLLHPDIYHPDLDLPAPFHTAHHQPPPSTPLPILLSKHQYRSAATACAIRLTTPPAPPPAELFSLLYTRLACLALTNHLPFAAEEAKALEDIHNQYYIDEGTSQCILPWELRILVVRLQGIAFVDWKRAIGGYYGLAKEARLAARNSKEPEEKGLWQHRLKELGLCVANALVEMGDLGAAARHLETLRGNFPHGNAINGPLVLVHLRLGDIEAAAKSLGDLDQSIMKPLLTMASGDYSRAVEELRALPPSDVVTQNLAVCLFYTGHVGETIKLLEGLVDKGRNFHALTFNLATCYELTNERPQKRKGELVEQVGEGIQGEGGGERQAGDFKL